MPWRGAVDIGGTFTDVALVEKETGRIADRPARRIAELLPWNWQPLDTTRTAA